MTFDEKQLADLLSEVEQQLDEVIKSETLAKSEALAKSKAKSMKKDEEKEEEKEEEKKDLEKDEDEKEEDCKKEEKESEDKEDCEKAEDEDKEEEKKDLEKDEDEKEEDEEEKKKKDLEKCGSMKKSEIDFNALSKSERLECYKELKKLIWKDQGIELAKAEKDAKTEVSIVETLQKSLSAKDVEIEALKNSVNEITKVLTIITEAPLRKSISSMAEVTTKPGEEIEISVSDLRKKANELTKTDSLTKSERKAIDSYFLSGFGEEEIKKIVSKK